MYACTDYGNNGRYPSRIAFRCGAKLCFSCCGMQHSHPNHPNPNQVWSPTPTILTSYIFLNFGQVSSAFLPSAPNL